MKLASSSLSFAEPIAAGDLSQLEWLDLCASELELDGVLFDSRHFPRTDSDYVAQLKKTSVDLGLTVAGLAAYDLTETDAGDAWFDVALGLGAPLLTLRAPQTTGYPDAWGAFVSRLKPLAARAKNVNVALAVRNDPATLCASGADLKYLVKDVDSSWLRFALDVVELGALDAANALVPKTLVAYHDVTDLENFARAGEPSAQRIVAGLRGFRAFVVVDRDDARGDRAAFHHAIARLRTAFARALLDESPAAQ